MSATTPPPLNRIGFRRSRKNSPTTPPPLNCIGFSRSRKNSATTPPPLNRVGMALHTRKRAPSLGKSWICDWSGPHYITLVRVTILWMKPCIHASFRSFNKFHLTNKYVLHACIRNFSSSNFISTIKCLCYYQHFE